MVVMAVMVDPSHFRLQPNVHVNFSVMAVMAVMVVTSHLRLQPNVQINFSVMAVMVVMVVVIFVYNQTLRQGCAIIPLRLRY